MPEWKKIESGEKKIKFNDVDSFRGKVEELKKLLEMERDSLLLKLNSANEALYRAKYGGGK